MTHIMRRPAFAAAMAIACCWATLAPTASNEAVAQGVQVYRQTNGYYNGYGTGYYNGYGNGYTGYGNGPYGYGSNGRYGYPQPTTTPYGYGNSPGFRLNIGGLQIGGGTYRPNTSYYSPYGRWGY